MSRIFTFFFMFFSTSSFGQNNTEYRIDLEEEKRVTASSVFNQIKYIPLEYTRESEIMRIEKFFVFDNRIIVVDNFKNSIFIFDTTGKFIRAIREVHQAKTLLPTFFYDDVWVDRSSKILKITSRDLKYKNIYTYDLNGNFLGLEEITNFESILSNNYASLSTQLRLYYQIFSGDMTKRKPEDQYVLFATDTLSNRIKSYEKMDSFSSSATPPDLLHYGEEKFTQLKEWITFFSIPYQNKLLKFNGDKLEEVFNFIFPAVNTLPADYLYNKEYDKKRIEYLQAHPTIVFGLEKAAVLKNWAIFSLATFDNRLKGQTYLYDVNKDLLVGSKSIFPDQSNFFLPIHSSDNVFEFHSNGIYNIIYPDDFLMAVKESSVKKRNIDYPLPMKNLIEKPVEKLNPFLVLIDLK